MGSLELNTTDTTEIAKQLLHALLTVKPSKLLTKEETKRERIRFIRDVLDTFRHQILFREPSNN